MGRLVVFNQISLDGYFVDAHGDMSWAKEGDDDEYNAFMSQNASGGGALVFGRVTYDLMESFWTTPQAFAALPVVAERMNNLPKFVFSRTMSKASWQNTTVLEGNVVSVLRKMKDETPRDMAILGSGSIVAQIALSGVVDEYQMVVNPIVLGAGRTMFDGVAERFGLRLKNCRTFRSGKVFVSFATT